MFLYQEPDNLIIVIGLHRSLVFAHSDPTHNTAKVLTQTDVVRYFLENVDIFPEIQRALSVNVASTMTGEDLASVTEDTLFVDALQKFKFHSAIPVVNNWGISYLFLYFY